jgi:hypothetical protein
MMVAAPATAKDNIKPIRYSICCQTVPVFVKPQRCG